MSYQLDADYSKVFMFPPSIEDFVAQDDPVRFIRAFVDSLDLKELGFRIRDTTESGRPGFAGSLLLKIWLFGSYERIHSSRELERQCRRDLALLWLTGMNYPDHNTLWRFWSDNKAAIKKLFKESVRVAMKNELVGMVYHAIDGTKIGANASRFKGLGKEEMKHLLAKTETYVEAMSQAVDKSGDSGADDRLPSALQDAQELRKRVRENVEALQSKKNGILSSTDMDSRKMRTNRGTIEYSYNAQAVVDDKTGVIVGADVSQEETDRHLLNTMLQEVKDTTHGNAKDSTADAGYFSGDELEKIEQLPENVYVHIPVEHNRSADKTSDDPFHGSHFVYDTDSDTFCCPKGHRLVRVGENRGFVTYRCESFEHCRWKSACTRSKSRKLLTVHKCHEAIRRHKRKIMDEQAQWLLRRRGQVIERVFGWIKEHFKLRRMPSRGIANAHATWYLACTVYNLRKIWLYSKGLALSA